MEGKKNQSNRILQDIRGILLANANINTSKSESSKEVFGLKKGYYARYTIYSKM